MGFVHELRSADLQLFHFVIVYAHENFAPLHVPRQSNYDTLFMITTQWSGYHTSLLRVFLGGCCSLAERLRTGSLAATGSLLVEVLVLLQAEHL